MLDIDRCFYSLNANELPYSRCINFERLQRGSVEGANGEHALGVGGKGGGIAAFGEGGRTGVQNDGARIFGIGRNELLQVGVAEDKYVARRTDGEFLVVVNMAVGDEKAKAVVDYKSVGGLDGKVEQHLVNF